VASQDPPNRGGRRSCRASRPSWRSAVASVTGWASASHSSAASRITPSAAGIAATAPIASKLTTVALRDGGHADFDAALQWEALAQPVTLATADLQEGLLARQQRRPPRFTGR